ncbi:MFS transporter [Brevibacillus centrosporus]|uniref:MFS transporter n=1 Tax=Brevibacillus centrosporus TaxID=54910 RepID=UPI000F09B45B|nr:MFS transporter [Brevibacillus centrosporus]MEC2129630.1 MFS transporter [Brevibacillus centrosporus]RNB65768.1 MFS transporter [Brevibacillus centrosporus]GED29988.1 MFS transporter [Brevibacillus centrosporus]
MTTPKMFASLGIRDFRFLWLSTAMANSGQYAFTVAASWLIFSLSHSTALVGAAVFATMIPGVLFGPVIGVMVDRFDRKRLLSIALLCNACNTGCLAILSGLGVINPFVVITSAFFLGVFFNLQMTCTNAIMPDLIPKQSLFNATALQGSVQHGAGFLGSALASPLLVWVGPAAVFTLCFLLYTAACVQSQAISFRPAIRTYSAAPLSGNLFHPILEGIRYIRQTPILNLLIVMVGLHCLLTMAYTSLLPQFIRDDLAADGGIYGTLMMLIGLGAIIGNLSTASISTPRGQGILYLTMAVASGLSLFALGFTYTPVLAFIVGLTVGASQAVFMAINLSFLLQRTSDEYRGRVASVNFILASGAMAFGNFLYGSLSQMIPPKMNMLTTGGSFVILVVLMLIFSPTLRSFYQKPAQPKENQMSSVM